MTNVEEFRVHPRHSAIRVSDRGRVLRRRTPGRRSVDPDDFVWAEARQYRTPNGYYFISVPGDGEWVREYVHRLVLETFVGPCPEGCETRHVNDRDTANNRLDNLAWGTPHENWVDRIRHGTALFGSSHGAAKLTEADVDEMRALRRAGVPRGDIAAEFGITPTHVSKVIAGKMWGHVPVTPAERADLKRLGYARGDRHYRTKTTPAVREEMARLRADGVPMNEIAARHQTSRQLVWRAIKQHYRETSRPVTTV